MGVLHREFSELYNAELEQRPADLPLLSIQYKDYAAWHNAQLESDEINQHKDYWLGQFKGELPVLELPSDRVRPKVMTYNGGSVYRELDKQTTDRLKVFSQDQGGTMFMTLQLALNILLHKYTGQEDIVIGSPIAGRDHPDLEGQIGFYLGALPIRTTFSKEDTITTLYQKIKQNTLGAYTHQLYPYDELVDALNLTRDMSRNPLFDVWFDYHSQELESEGLSFKQIEHKEYFLSTGVHQTKFDLTIVVQEHQGGGLGLYWEYNRDIYSSSQMEQMEGLQERADAEAGDAGALQNRLHGGAVAETHRSPGRVGDKLLHQIARDRNLVLEQQALELLAALRVAALAEQGGRRVLPHGDGRHGREACPWANRPVGNSRHPGGPVCHRRTVWLCGPVPGLRAVRVRGSL
jgi:hypothetical protein